jgi:hypothetical protein
MPSLIDGEALAAGTDRRPTTAAKKVAPKARGEMRKGKLLKRPRNAGG